MALGITGVVMSMCCVIFAIPLGIAALATGIIALSQLKADPLQQGRNQAIAGVCCGAAALVLPVALFALEISFFTLSS